VGVVITTHNHARFLGEALASVEAQTRAPDALVVVDDGSSDDPAGVVAGRRHVHFIRQERRGLAAARNTGLGALDTTYVVFLDADDRLEPRALEHGLACFGRVADCGFVYGGHLYIDDQGRQTGERFEPPGDDAYLGLLRGNFIAMHGTVMYRRDRLMEIAGFDERLSRCEDYDVYLRLARRYPVAGYPDLVAAYRIHGENMSANHRAMLRSALDVHARYMPRRREGRRARDAWRAGRRRWRQVYAEEMATSRYRKRLQGGSLAASLPAVAHILTAAPDIAAREMAGGLKRRIAQLLRLGSSSVGAGTDVPAVGRIRFGDLRRVTPISRDYGFDRGQPIDRYYIERFLARHASEIGGRVLEVGGDDYTRRFGGSRVEQADILHVHAGNPRATIVGDLTNASVLPRAAFDCIVITQTLQLVYDVRTAVANLHGALAPGGAVLLTAPGVSQVDRGEWGKTWFWSFTALALRRLFDEEFGGDNVMVEQYGNVFAATAFLQGIAVEEVDVRDLNPIDPAYPVILGVRARRSRD
jgi:glycosyltransferase involved in cell wall biosynthesis